MNSNALRILSLLLPLATQGILAGEIVTFSNRPASVSDKVTQTIQCDLDAERAIRQHNQVIDKSKQKLRRDQSRTVTVLAVVNGNAQRAHIRYAASSTKVAVDNGQVVEADQPIADKAYIVERAKEELKIVSEQGQPISEEEDQILRAQLQTFGLPNPLAGFLHGKKIRVGDEVDVPDEVARDLLGLTGNQGKTDGLTLRLTALRPVDRINCAVFETLLRSHSDESSISLLMKGELAIDPTTCQTRSINMHGPVAISERRGPKEGRFTVSTNGSLKVAVRTSREIEQTAARPSNLLK